MQSAATTPSGYLADLPDDRRPEVQAVLELVRGAIRPGFEETMSSGMIGWVVPLSTYPDTYNGSPLGYAGLAMQKRHNALYLMCLYADPESERDFRARWTAGGRRLDMGRSCLRYRRARDLDTDLVAEAVARYDAEEFVALYERFRAG